MMSGKQGHDCVLCGAVLETKGELQEHFRNHANNVIDKSGRPGVIVAKAECICDLCGIIYSTVNETIKHRFKAHPDCAKFYCPHCGKQFPLKIHRDKHIISHDLEKNVSTEHRKCEQCNFLFYNKKALAFHNNTIHESSSMRPFLLGKTVRKLVPVQTEHKCVLCNAKLESKDALREHFRKHANNEIDNNGRPSKVVPTSKTDDCRCDVCDKVYYSITEVIKHRFKVHPNSPKFYCCYCGKQFPLKAHRDKHMTSHDPDEVKIEDHKKCVECDAIFYNDKALNYHQSSAHKRIIQMLQPIATPPPSNKIKVNSMNDALSVYYCHLCGAEYVIKFNLQQHLERVHTQAEREAVPEDLIKCTMCSALFCNKRAYDNHNTYHKPNDLYVTSEQQRLKTITKVDQDFDIRRVSLRTYHPQPKTTRKRTERRQIRGKKRLKKTSAMKKEVEYSSSDEELSEPPKNSSDSESDVPLNQRIASS